MCLLNFVLFFRINYKCNHGDSIYVTGNIDVLGNWNPNRAIRLDWTDGHNWTKKLKIMHDNTQLIEYKYFVASSDIHTSFHYIRWEADPNRYIDLFTTSKLLIKLDDEWEHAKVKLALHHEAIKKHLENDRRVILYTNLDHIKSGHEMKLKKRELQGGMKEEWFWTISLQVPSSFNSFNYKYKLVGKSGEEAIADRGHRKFYLKQAPSHLGTSELYALKCSSKIKYDFSFSTCLNYNVITDDIIIGAFPKNVSDVNELVAMGVKGVLNLQTLGDMTRYGEDWDFLKSCYQNAGITVGHLPIVDSDLDELKLKMQDAVEKLHELLKEGKVYVHCTAGRHRAPHIIIYYLCCYQNYDLKNAVELVKSKRSKVKVKVFEEVFLKKCEKAMLECSKLL